jgi:hypothetical protein
MFTANTKEISEEIQKNYSKECEHARSDWKKTIIMQEKQTIRSMLRKGIQIK